MIQEGTTGLVPRRLEKFRPTRGYSSPTYRLLVDYAGDPRAIARRAADPAAIPSPERSTSSRRSSVS